MKRKVQSHKTASTEEEPCVKNIQIPTGDKSYALLVVVTWVLAILS